jgi:hypothetical protein
VQISLGYFQPNRLTGGDIVLRPKNAQENNLQETDNQFAKLLGILVES